jgi:hypothetical protein
MGLDKAPTRMRAVATPREARMSPDGFVAQCFPEHNFNGQGHWILTFWTAEAGLTVQIFSDEQVADWSPLSLTARDT